MESTVYGHKLLAMSVIMFNKDIWPIWLVVIHCIVDEQSETNCLGEILITIRW